MSSPSNDYLILLTEEINELKGAISKNFQLINEEKVNRNETFSNILKTIELDRTTRYKEQTIISNNIIDNTSYINKNLNNNCILSNSENKDSNEENKKLLEKIYHLENENKKINKKLDTLIKENKVLNKKINTMENCDTSMPPYPPIYQELEVDIRKINENINSLNISNKKIIQKITNLENINDTPIVTKNNFVVFNNIVKEKKIKKKILCLHGGGQTINSFKNMPGMKQLLNDLGDNFDFVFISSNESKNDDNLWLNDNKIDSNSPSNKAISSIKYIERYIIDNGPFYGILGFSQGVAIILSYLGYKKILPENKTFNKIFLFNGYIPIHNLDLMSGINDKKPFDNDTLIFTAENDNNFKHFSVDLNNNYFNNSELLISKNSGHALPTKLDSKYQLVVDFFNSKLEVNSEPKIVSSNYKFDIIPITKNLPPSIILVKYLNFEIRYQIVNKSDIKNNHAYLSYNKNYYLPQNNKLLRYSESGIITMDYIMGRITIIKNKSSFDLTIEGNI